MPTAYETELLNKKYRPNVVIQFGGQIFSIASPDSGLVVPSPYNKSVQNFTVAPTTVDLLRTNQTIASYSFKIIDKSGVLTAMTIDRAATLMGATVEIWVGRITGSFDFADYFKLPDTKIKKIDHDENAYYFSTSESTDRMNKPVFNLAGKLAVDIFAVTTTFTLLEDISAWPTSGTGKIDSEFFSWTGVNVGLKQLTGVVRGQKNTTPAAHSQGADIYNVYDVSENPIDILLKILISNGGGGAYDVYPDGFGIDPTLIDLTAIEAIRDSLFQLETFTFSLYNITNGLKFLEDEILKGCNCRFITSSASKISLTILDQSVFGDDTVDMDEDTITTYPKWEVSDNNIVNVVTVDWDWDEGTQLYRQQTTYTDATSIATYGQRAPINLKLKGPRAASSGLLIANDRADRILTRFSQPNPTISFKTHIDKHLAQVGSKALVTSSQIPALSGTLQFATELEIVSKGINFETGDVSFKLAFTSYSGIRPCYIAPSDLLVSITDQSNADVPAGRGLCYEVGWVVLLWDVAANDYAPDPINTIAAITGDTITFTDPWTTVLSANNYRLKFCDYDDATSDQKRYCFISDMGLDFADGRTTYSITF